MGDNSMESEQVAELQKALDELKKQSQIDQRRLVKRLKELHDAERHSIIEDYESRLAKLAQEHDGNMKSKQSEIDRSSERLTIMTNMVDKLKQARIDLLEKIERKDADYMLKEESMSTEIHDLKTEIARMKQSSLDDNRALEEITARYTLEISQLQEQLVAAQAALKVVQMEDSRSRKTPNVSSSGDGDDAIPNDADRSQDLLRLNEALNKKIFELESAHNASVEECAALKIQIERESSKVARFKRDLDSTIKSSELLEKKIATMQKELVSLRKNEEKKDLTITSLESEIQRLLSEKCNISDCVSDKVSHHAAAQHITDRPLSADESDSAVDQINVLNNQISSYQQRVLQLEVELASKSDTILTEAADNAQLTSSNQDDSNIASNHDDILDKLFNNGNHFSSRQYDDAAAVKNTDFEATFGRSMTALEGLNKLVLDLLKDREASRNILDRQVTGDNIHVKYDQLAATELGWHEICDYQQDVISALICLQSDHDKSASNAQPLQQTIDRLKQIIKEQIEQHKLRISNSNEKISSLESLLAAEKKKVQQLVAALKRMKESAPDSQTLKLDLDSALARATSAEQQVAHLQRSLEAIEQAQKDSVQDHRSAASKIEHLTSTLKAEQDRVKALEDEKQQISSLLIRANKTVGEMKDANQSLSGRLSRLSTMIFSHWLFDTSSATANDQSPEFQVNQRCRVNDGWWLFIEVKLRSGDEVTSQFFWTTIEAFDIYSGRKITTGIVADAELVDNRAAALLSSGVSLPESIEFQSELNLKAKFDKKWSSAAKKFEKKITDLNQKLRSSQSEIDGISSEFEEYRKHAELALDKNSGGAIKMAEALDQLDALKQERDSLQHSLQQANQRSVDSTNAEIQRLTNLIETNRALFHQSELKWSQELQAAQIENERLISKSQKEESAMIESLNERLRIAQDEMQRHRNSATEIIKERDNTISGLHKQFVAANEQCQDLQRQVRILQAELVSLSKQSPRQAHRSTISEPSEPMQQPLFESPLQQRRSSTDSGDHAVHIQKLQSLLRDSELQREHQAAQLRQLQSQVRELSKSNERSGANLDYLKHIIVKYMETDEGLTLLPVIANILAFDEEETERIRRRLEKSASTGLIPKIW